MFRIIFVIVLCFLQSKSNASTHFTQISIENGLPSGAVVSVFSDNLGFIWVTTPHGVSVYDGEKVHPVRPSNDDLTAYKTMFGSVDKQGNVLLSVNGRRLVKFDPLLNMTSNLHIIENSNEAASSDLVSDFISLSANEILLSSNKEIWLVKANAENQKLVDLSDYLSGRNAVTAMIEKDGLLLIGTTNGLYSLNLANLELHQYQHVRSNKIYDLELFDGQLFIAYSDSLVSVDLSKFTSNDDRGLNSLNEKLLDKGGPYLLTQGNDVLYVASPVGIYQITPSAPILTYLFSLRDIKSDIKSSLVYSMAVDNSGRVWFGTESDGVIAWDPAAIKFNSVVYDAYTKNSLPHNIVWDVLPDRLDKHMLWVATSGGIAKVNTKDGSVDRHSIPSLVDNQVFNIGAELSKENQRVLFVEQASDGHLWLRGHRQLCRYNPVTKQEIMFGLSDEANSLLALSEEQITITNHNQLWGFFWDQEVKHSKLFSVDLTTSAIQIHNQLTPFTDTNNAIITVFSEIYNDDRILIGSSDKLYVYQPDNGQVKLVFELNEDVYTPNRSYYISHVHLDSSRDLLWIGIDGLGLYGINSHSFEINHSYIDENSPFHQSVASILQDKSNNIWLSSIYGLTRIKPDTGLMQHFDASSGLISNEFIELSATSLDNGTLAFGSVRGLIYFNPLSLENKASQSEQGVFIRNIDSDLVKSASPSLLYNQNIQLNLPYQYDPVKISVVSPSSFGSVNPSYGYAIDGNATSLTGDLKGQEFTLPNLIWGKYQLIINYINPYSGAVRYSNPVHITVDKPVWVTWPAWLLYIAVLMLLMLTVALVSVRKMKVKNQKINQMVKQRTEELEVANRTKDRFLANMSHEIRTPLTTIMGFADSISKGLVDNTQMPLTLRHIKTSSTHLLNIIDSILDLNKLNAETFELVYQDVSLTELIDEVVLPIRHMAENKGLLFSLELSPSLPEMISTDETRLKQVLLNICGNAIKFTDHGQVTVAVDTIEHDIVISVVDSGIGICKQDLAILFAPFERGKRDSVRYFDGTGLGLDISKRICDAFGGTITVISDVGLGSRFTIRLPLILTDLTVIDEQSASNPVLPISDDIYSRIVAVDQTSPTMSNVGKKLLIVDDFEVNIDLLKLLLKSEDIKIVSATSGLQALQMLETDTDISLVLMDIQMPHMDGIETFTQLRAWNKLIPVLAFTANNMTHEIERYKDLGFDGYVSKPIVLENLLSSIRAHF